jgi:hypothetical protein
MNRKAPNCGPLENPDNLEKKWKILNLPAIKDKFA